MVEKKSLSYDPAALFRIGYGLYVVTAREAGRDNGLVVNAVTQVTNTPDRVAVVRNKASLTHDMICKTGQMNVNCLSEQTPYSLFQTFGMHSGREVDKFRDFTPQYAPNGVAILPQYLTAWFSLEVEQYVDVGTHGMFICRVRGARVVSEGETMTYGYYYAHVKPKPPAEKKQGYVCRVCGYVYEGKELPPDFICPLCHHGVADFEPIT